MSQKLKSDGKESVVVKLASLYSGGKDSTYAAYIMEQRGHTVDQLVSVVPASKDSWVFHSHNLHLLPLMAEAMNKELVFGESSGDEGDDLQALHDLLFELDVDGVITGALASDYQWDRINGICKDLGLPTFSPLWRKEEKGLLKEMISAGLKVIIVGVFAEGVDHEWLGRRIDAGAIEELEEIEEQYGINVSGEGGEYETLVLDSPLHHKRMSVISTSRHLGRIEGSLVVDRAELEEKK